MFVRNKLCGKENFKIFNLGFMSIAFPSANLVNHIIRNNYIESLYK